MLCTDCHTDCECMCGDLQSTGQQSTLDQGAKDILESLLHDLPERRLTATQLLNKPWLYEAQGKPFPTDYIFTRLCLMSPATSPVALSDVFVTLSCCL